MSKTKRAISKEDLGHAQAVLEGEGDPCISQGYAERMDRQARQTLAGVRRHPGWKCSKAKVDDSGGYRLNRYANTFRKRGNDVVKSQMRTSGRIQIQRALEDR